MAKISSFGRTIDGIDYVITVNCNSEGVFTINLPGVIANAIGQYKCEGDTKEAVEKSFNLALVKFNESRTSRRKVIVYKVLANINVDGMPGGHRNDFHFSDGVAIGIEAGVFEEIAITSGSNTYYRYENIHSKFSYSSMAIMRLENHCRKDYVIIPWTQEAEDFLADTSDAFTGLVFRLIDFFEKGGMEKALESGVLPMLLPAPVKEEENGKWNPEEY